MVTAVRERLNGTGALNVTLETITPQVAGDWLEKNTRNRKLNDRTVQILARAIRRGDWKLNAETMKFSRGGMLIDGQHRLSAVIVADMPIQSLVAWDVDENVFDTIDTGKRRSTADVMHLRGEVNTNQLAAALRLLHLWRTGNSFSEQRHAPSTIQLEELLDREPTIRTSITATQAAKKKLQNANHTILSVCHHLFSEIDRSAAHEFFGQLEKGTGLEETDPIYLLRERLSRPQRRDMRITIPEMGAYIIKAWNAHRQRKSIRLLVWKTTEDYPQPV